MLFYGVYVRNRYSVCGIGHSEIKTTSVLYMYLYLYRAEMLYRTEWLTEDPDRSLHGYLQTKLIEVCRYDVFDVAAFSDFSIQYWRFSCGQIHTQASKDSHEYHYPVLDAVSIKTSCLKLMLLNLFHLSTIYTCDSCAGMQGARGCPSSHWPGGGVHSKPVSSISQD